MNLRSKAIGMGRRTLILPLAALCDTATAAQALPGGALRDAVSQPSADAGLVQPATWGHRRHLSIGRLALAAGLVVCLPMLIDPIHALLLPYESRASRVGSADAGRRLAEMELGRNLNRIQGLVPDRASERLADLYASGRVTVDEYLELARDIARQRLDAPSATVDVG